MIPSVCRKGQASTEFFLYLTVFMLVVISAFVLVSYLQNSEIPVQKNKLAVETGYNFQNVILLTVRAGPGFDYLYYFPKTIHGYPYSIKLFKDHMIMDWTNEYGNFSYYFSVPPYTYKAEERSVDSGCIVEGTAGGDILYIELVSDNCANRVMLNHTLSAGGSPYIAISRESG